MRLQGSGPLCRARKVRQAVAGRHRTNGPTTASPYCMLQEAFEATFFRALGVEAAEFRKVADHFYADVFGGSRT